MPLPRSAVRIWNRELHLDYVLTPFFDSALECFQTTIYYAIIEMDTASTLQDAGVLGWNLKGLWFRHHKVYNWTCETSGKLNPCLFYLCTSFPKSQILFAGGSHIPTYSNFCVHKKILSASPSEYSYRETEGATSADLTMRCDATGLSGCVQGWKNEFPRCWIMALLAPHMVVGCNCNESCSCTTWGGNRYFGSLWTRQGQPRFYAMDIWFLKKKEAIERGSWLSMLSTPFNQCEKTLVFWHSFAQFTKDVIEGCHCEAGIAQRFKPQIVMVQLQLAFTQRFTRIPVA